MADIAEIKVEYTTANVTVPTTTETVAISSGPVRVPQEAVAIAVLGYCQLTTGTGATAVTPRIRQGTTISGPLVGEANAETLKAAAGGTEPFVILVLEPRSGQAEVEYSLTVQQTGATANGTILQAEIIVAVLRG
jgi:hypothetical protein